MNHIALPVVAVPLRRPLQRVAVAVRGAVCISSGRCVLDCVEEPAGLQYRPCARTRRLMRTARVSPW